MLDYMWLRVLFLSCNTTFSSMIALHHSLIFLCLHQSVRRVSSLFQDIFSSYGTFGICLQLFKEKLSVHNPYSLIIQLQLIFPNIYCYGMECKILWWFTPSIQFINCPYYNKLEIINVPFIINLCNRCCFATRDCAPDMIVPSVIQNLIVIIVLPISKKMFSSKYN